MTLLIQGCGRQSDHGNCDVLFAAQIKPRKQFQRDSSNSLEYTGIISAYNPPAVRKNNRRIPFDTNNLFVLNTMNRAKIARGTQASIRHLSRGISTHRTIPLIINGKDVISKTTFEAISPLTCKKASDCSSASQEHVQSAVAAAQAAFPAWATTKPSYRRDIFLAAANIMTKRREELGEYLNQEIGADQGYQDFIIGLSIEGLKDTAGRIAGACQGFVPESVHEGMKAMVLKRPYGVNLGIAPW